MIAQNICLIKKHLERFFALRAGGRFLGIALFLAGWYTALPAQDFELLTQAQVNAFDPNITSISGSLFIGDTHPPFEQSDITDLTPLSNLTSVGGLYFFIWNNPGLTSLNGLQNITSSGNQLNIQLNSNLINLDGLQNLTTVMNLNVLYNNSLTSLDGLNNAITYIGGTLAIQGNPNLTDIGVLQNITHVSNYLKVYNNTALTDCSPICVLLNTPGAVEGPIQIHDNNTGCDSQQEISTDTDGDGTADCIDGCPLDPNKTQAGICGCGVADTDTDGDGTVDCLDTDDDNDGCPDASDAHPLVYSADSDCDGVHNDCDHCPGGDDNGPCNATSVPPLNTLPAYWLCGNNNQKVKVCHNGTTKCVDLVGAANHLAHGDFLGPCTSCAQSAQAPGGGNTASNGFAAADASGFDLLPNPASSKVTVVLEDVEGAAALSVFDALGRELARQQVEAGVVRFDLDLPEGQFPAGKYFVRLRTGDEVLTRVLVVQR